MVLAPSPELAGALRLLARRVGFAARKAKPALDGTHQTRLLCPLYEVLDDLCQELEAGSFQCRVANSHPDLLKEVDFLAAVAGGNGAKLSLDLPADSAILSTYIHTYTHTYIHTYTYTYTYIH